MCFWRKQRKMVMIIVLSQSKYQQKCGAVGEGYSDLISGTELLQACHQTTTAAAQTFASAET